MAHGGIVRIEVKKAIDLLACDTSRFGSGKSDPFVVAVALSVIGQEADKSKVKTSHKKKDLNPEWNEVLEVGKNYDITDYQGIRIKVGGWVGGWVGGHITPHDQTY
jgi:Ca2+-dependent lipid-binding protein